ncbi:hypothetical protein CFP56_013847 [Quercus suber]|uniref:Uncharacterized protein n=1 Tax=Quercus suber TaxID=58331 RepID=A0AAW0M553_QUESU
MAAPTIRCLALTVLTVIVLWDSNIHEVIGFHLWEIERMLLESTPLSMKCIAAKNKIYAIIGTIPLNVSFLID